MEATRRCPFLLSVVADVMDSFAGWVQEVRFICAFILRTFFGVCLFSTDYFCS